MGAVSGPTRPPALHSSLAVAPILRVAAARRLLVASTMVRAGIPRCCAAPALALALLEISVVHLHCSVNQPCVWRYCPIPSSATCASVAGGQDNDIAGPKQHGAPASILPIQVRPDAVRANVTIADGSLPFRRPGSIVPQERP